MQIIIIDVRSRYSYSIVGSMACYRKIVSICGKRLRSISIADRPNLILLLSYGMMCSANVKYIVQNAFDCLQRDCGYRSYLVSNMFSQIHFYVLSSAMS